MNRCEQIRKPWRQLLTFTVVNPWILATVQSKMEPKEKIEWPERLKRRLSRVTEGAVWHSFGQEEILQSILTKSNVQFNEINLYKTTRNAALIREASFLLLQRAADFGCNKRALWAQR